MLSLELLEETMERFWQAALGVAGIASIGAFVFWSLYSKWLTVPELFARLTQWQTFIVMLVFLGLTFLALIAAFLLHSRTRKESDDVFPLYEKLRAGLGSPKENVAQIERIANSSDPKKEIYLRELASLPDISFLEGDAINHALSDIASKIEVNNLLDRVKSEEMLKIDEMIPKTDDPLFRPILVGSKYWRYANRKSHPQFKKMNDFIAIAMVKGFNEEARALSKELASELQNLE